MGLNLVVWSTSSGSRRWPRRLERPACEPMPRTTGWEACWPCWLACSPNNVRVADLRRGGSGSRWGCAGLRGGGGGGNTRLIGPRLLLRLGRRSAGRPGFGLWQGLSWLREERRGLPAGQILLLRRARMCPSAERLEEVEQRAEGHVSGDVAHVGIVPARLRDKAEAGDRR